MDPFVEDLLQFARSETYGVVLKRILEFEDKVARESGWRRDGTFDGRPQGWEWHEVSVQPGYLVRLAHAGVLGVVGRSDRHIDYRLTDPELVRKALAGDLETGGPPADPPEETTEIPSDLFDAIVGFDDVKDLFLRALSAEKPVHVCLIGPPASAKTLFLMELGRLPGARFVVGGGSSKAGLTELLLAYRPLILLLDEIETIDSIRDYSVLLHLMENQEVIETKFQRHVRVPLKARVFAAGNDDSRLPPALQSRFGGTRGVMRFREYASAEFLEVARSVLVRREFVAEDFAAKVAESMLRIGVKDVRAAIRIARLAKDEEGLESVIGTMQRRR